MRSLQLSTTYGFFAYYWNHRTPGKFNVHYHGIFTTLIPTQRASPKIIDKRNFLFARTVSFGGSELWPVHIATNGFNLEHKVYTHLYCIVLCCSEQSVRLCMTQILWYTLTSTTGNEQRATCIINMVAFTESR